MRKILMGLGFALALAIPSFAETVDEVIAKNMEARGGLEKIKAVQSMRFTGTMTIGPGMEAPAVLELKRPNKMRMDLTFQGMTATQAYDGKAGWQVMPFQGNPNAEPMSPEDLKDADEQADMDGPLVDYKAKGNKVELIGKDKVEGTDAYKLQLTLKNGDVRYVYLDTETYLEIKGESKRMVRGTEVETEQTVGDYKEVGGLLIPHAFENGAKGRPEKQKISIQKVELNPTLDEGRFAMPVAKTEPPAKPKN
jgi:outer membrane lipoprotein-sorting protein